MNRILMNSLIAVAAIILLLQPFLFENLSIIYPATILFLIGVMLVNHFLILKKIKTGIFFQVGINKNPIKSSLFWFGMGTFWVVLGLMDKHSFQSWNGMDYRFFIGIILYANIFFQYNKFEILLKDDSILFTGLTNGGIWRNSKITKVLIHKNIVTLFRKGNRKTFTFDENDILIIKKYFSEKINDRLELQ